MADSVVLKLEGIDALRQTLTEAKRDIRNKAVRNALRKGARIIQGAAKDAAPVLQVPTAYRRAGTVRKAIAVRTSKFARRAGNIGVFVGVRPLRGSRQLKYGKAGAKNPNDPFYWRFVEFGTKKMAGRRFLSRAAQKGEEAVRTIVADIVPQIERLNRKV